MNNLVKCKRCKQTIIDEHFHNHICTVPVKDIKKINAEYFIQTKDSAGRTIIEVKDLDGIIREFTIIPDEKEEFNKIPYQPTFDSKKNNRRFDRTHSSNIYKLNTTAIDG